MKQIIYSTVLEQEIWITDEPGFVPTDGKIVFNESELALVADKTPAQLRKIAEVKKIFGGGIVRK